MFGHRVDVLYFYLKDKVHSGEAIKRLKYTV